MNLILQLKHEHVEIMRTFESIKLGVASGKMGDSDLIEELSELKNILIVHLDLEDKMLYPALVKVGGEVKKSGEKFSGEMLGISKTVMIFFDKYMKEEIADLLKSSEFRKELDTVVQSVSKRVNSEEEILFPLYERYVRSQVVEK